MQLGRSDTDLLDILRSEIAKAGATRIGVAVSGGGDSMAMLHLAAALGDRYRVEAITVDHGLRSGSDEEAEFVQRVCATLAVPHATARWAGWNGEGNLQARARRARYRLIAEWANRRKLHLVLVGHTQDDVAETFLIRLGRAAGVDGLSEMDMHFDREGMRFLRPFLSVSREDLRQFLTRHRQEWREDPSNENEVFQRVRARRALETFDALGITADNLATVARNMRDARDVLESQTRQLAQRCVKQVCGDLLIDPEQFSDAAKELRRRLLIAVLTWVSQTSYSPRRAPIDDLDQSIAAGRNFSLAGCMVTVTRSQIRVAREFNKVRDLREYSPSWDRWHLQGPWEMGMEVRALGEPGLTEIADWRESQLPRKSLMATPSVWKNGKLLAAPLAGLPNDWQAELKSPDFLTCL